VNGKSTSPEKPLEDVTTSFNNIRNDKSGDSLTVERQSRVPGDSKKTTTQRDPQNVTPQPAKPAKSLVNGKSTSPEKPLEEVTTNFDNLQNEKSPKVQSAPPISAFVVEGQVNFMPETPKPQPIIIKPRESPKITAALISDIIDALGSHQPDDIAITDHLSPKSTASELESVWSEDSVDIAHAARKFRGAPQAAREVRLSSV